MKHASKEPSGVNYPRMGKNNANKEFGGWKNYYDLYYLKYGGVVRGQL